MKITSIVRRTILFVVLGLCFSLNAQTVSHDFKNTINDVFAGVDLTKVPHHLLLDYAMEFVDIRSYNGVVNDTNYVHKGISPLPTTPCSWRAPKLMCRIW